MDDGRWNIERTLGTCTWVLLLYSKHVRLGCSHSPVKSSLAEVVRSSLRTNNTIKTT